MVKVSAKEPIEVKRFDLNIEKILENWEVCHGIREEIVNAIDEQALTNSKEIEMFKLYRKFLFCCGSWEHIIIAIFPLNCR
jgi:hypothetical protein